MSSNNEYMRVYMKERYRRRRQEALAFLGGKCVKCGTVENLEFDHKDPDSKWKTIAKIWSYSKVKFWAEIEKCQLLCREHHDEKTLKELGRVSAKGMHGTLSALRYCEPRCDLCKAVKAAYDKAHRDKSNEARRLKRQRLRESKSTPA